MVYVNNLRAFDALGLVLGSWLVYKIWRIARSRANTTKLSGPPATSWLFGVTKDVFDGDAGDIFENWTKQYGSVFQIPGPLGERRLILTDPKAIAHCWAKTFTYNKTRVSKQTTINLVGKGILWAEGEQHRRQRRSLNTAFTNAAIRDLASIFFENACKVRNVWDSILRDSSSGEAIIDVARWVSCVSLDSIGIAGFGHDFGSLRGEHGVVEEAFNSMSTVPNRGFDAVLFLLAFVAPFLLRIPTKRQVKLRNLNKSLQGIAENLLQSNHADKEVDVTSDLGRTVIGALIKAESAEAKSNLTKDEIIAQMKTLIFAGSETTSVTLTWALIELALHPDKQERLRKELLQLGDSEPSYDQLTNELPYLDAFFREILRLHSPVHQNHRLTTTEDVIPLSKAIMTASGEVVDRITVGADVPLTIPIRAINRSEEIWGPDAKEFKPERWFDNEAGLTPQAKGMPGFHHMASFIDGPRICIGKLFAVAEFKAVIAVLVRSYAFEMRDGPQTKLVKSLALLQRPKVEGEEGYALPMRVRRI